MRTTALLLIAILTAPTGVFAQEAASPAQYAPRPTQYYYSGVGSPDAAMVQRVATTLGVGKTVEVTISGQKRLRAKIQSIGANGFTVAHGRDPVPRTITYGEVTQLKAAGWPIGAKVALVSGAIVGGSILLWFVNIVTCQCG